MVVDKEFSVKNMLQNLHDSRKERQYKMCDCSTDEGREGLKISVL